MIAFRNNVLYLSSWKVSLRYSKLTENGTYNINSKLCRLVEYITYIKIFFKYNFSDIIVIITILFQYC